MKKYFTMLATVAVCGVLVACGQNTTFSSEAEMETPAVILQEQAAESQTPGLNAAPKRDVPIWDESIEVSAALPEEEPIVDTKKEPIDKLEEIASDITEESCYADEGSDETEPAEEASAESDESAGADYDQGYSEELLQIVLELCERRIQQERQEAEEQQSNDSSTEVKPEYAVPPEINSAGFMVGVPDPQTGLIGRSDEAVQQFLDDFLAGYKDTESFYSLEGEGLQYVDACLDIIRNDPYSSSSVTRCIERYLSGYYDDEDFTFMLESWIEIAGPFGSGKIYVL